MNKLITVSAIMWGVGIWMLVLLNTYAVDRLETQTISINPAEVRKLMTDCDGVFKIHQEHVEDIVVYRVECQERR